MTENDADNIADTPKQARDTNRTQNESGFGGGGSHSKALDSGESRSAVPPKIPTHKNGDESAKRFAKSTLASLAILTALLFFFPDVSLKPDPSPDTDAYVSMTPYVGELAGIADLMDYSPLFIPTKWNAKSPERHPELPKGWTFPAKIEDNPGGDILKQEFLSPDVDEKVIGQIGLLRSVMRSAFSSFRRTDMTDVESATPAVFELVDLKSGETLKSESLPSEISDKMRGISEFSINIDSDGWTSKPFLRRSGGDESVDSELSLMLNGKSLLYGIPAGSYRAVFTP